MAHSSSIGTSSLVKASCTGRLVELPPPSWSNQAAEMAQQVRDAGALSLFSLLYLPVQKYVLTGTRILAY